MILLIMVNMDVACTARWDSGVERMDNILYNKSVHSTELNKDLRLGPSLTSEYRAEVHRSIVKYWDCFVKEGARRPILGYEFGIDNSGANPVYCKTPSCGPYGSKIIMSQLEGLLGSKWVEE